MTYKLKNTPHKGYRTFKWIKHLAKNKQDFLTCLFLAFWLGFIERIPLIVIMNQDLDDFT